MKTARRKDNRLTLCEQYDIPFGWWNRVWTTQDGDHIRVRHMTANHIRNCIRLLDPPVVLCGFGEDDEPYADYDPEAEEWLNIFRAELDRRGEPHP